MDKIKFVALGGLDEDGKDLYVIEVNDDLFVFVCGFKYPTKLTPGIDFIIADFSYLKERKDKIKGYILPKTKKNSYGALPYVYKECPAPIYCTESTKHEFLRFAEYYQQMSDFEFNIFTLPSRVVISGHEFTFFSVCASMPLSCGFALKTNLGNIVYSGDFIVEYNNEQYYKLDLNTLGKIAEDPTLILLSESSNSAKQGYCSPNHRLYPFFDRCFEEMSGRTFVALVNDNLYHVDELFNACIEHHKRICFYDEKCKELYDNNRFGKYLPKIDIVPLDDILRVKEDDLVILISDEQEGLYEKISLLTSGENEHKQVRLNPNDNFILGCVATDNLEVIATAVIDDIFKTGCNVKYVAKKNLYKMHACEEDLRMLLSLFKPKYYLPIEGYYVDLLNNAKIAYGMKLGLNHTNIFLLDNGQSVTLTQEGAKIDYNLNEANVTIGDLMIDGIGVGDVVNEIIDHRTRLGADGVIVFGCAISKSERKIVYGPDVQTRGFVYLKDKEAEMIMKEITQIYLREVTNWCYLTKDFDNFLLEENIKEQISRYLKRGINRDPVVQVNVMVLD